jgi:hypothetical protein
MIMIDAICANQLAGVLKGSCEQDLVGYASDPHMRSHFIQ